MPVIAKRASALTDAEWSFKIKNPPPGKTWAVGVFNATDASNNFVTAYLSNAVIARGPQEPSTECDNDGKLKYNPDHVKFMLSGNSAQDYLKTVENFDRQRVAWLATSKWAGKKLCLPMVMDKYSDEAGHGFAGKLYTDFNELPEKRLSLLLDFSIPPWKANDKDAKPDLVILDGRKPRKSVGADSKVRTVYPPLLIDGEPVTRENAYTVFTSGSSIIRAYVKFGDATVSNYGVSNRQVIREIVIIPRERSAEDVRIDDESEDENAVSGSEDDDCADDESADDETTDAAGAAAFLRGL